MTNIVHNIDCKKFIRTIPDKHYDITFIDPPYGLNMTKMRLGKGNSKALAPSTQYVETEHWDNKAPSKQFFKELIRISKNQIIFGANHFIQNIPNANAKCWLVWDKAVPDGMSYAQAELAWTSFDKTVKKFNIAWNGFRQQNMRNREQRIHPTQKPVMLYQAILNMFANPGDIIFDGFVGSGSIRIACHKLGYDFEGCEINKSYYDLQEQRYNDFLQQGILLHENGKE